MPHPILNKQTSPKSLNDKIAFEGMIPKILAILVAVASVVFMSWPAALDAADAVLINEVAWMGTASNAADEWVELYNSSASSVDLTGWGLYEAGGSTLILTLAGSIPAGGYYLIERTDDNSISDITADVFGPFAGSGLNNGGEYLVLKDSTGAVVDSVDASAGWPAGDNVSKASMERKLDGTWQTNDGLTINGKDTAGGNIIGTPKAVNNGSAPAPTPPAEPAPERGSGTAYTETSTTTPAIILKAVAGADIVAEVNQTIKFDGSKSEGAASYKWYLGDGSVKDGATVDHVYQFSGTYLVTLEVSSDSEIALDQIRVSIFGGKAVISEIFPSAASGTPSWIELFNPTKSTLDIGNWILDIGGKNFIWPQFTIIPAGGFLVLSQNISGLNVSTWSVKLKYPNSLTIDEVILEKIVAGSSASRTSGGFFWTKEPTPGRANIVTSSGGALLENTKVAPNLVALKPENLPAKNYLASFYSQVSEAAPEYAQASVTKNGESSFFKKLSGNILSWAALIIILSLLIGLFYVRVYKKR